MHLLLGWWFELRLICIKVTSSMPLYCAGLWFSLHWNHWKVHKEKSPLFLSFLSAPSAIPPCWRLKTRAQMHILHTYLHVRLTNTQRQTPHTWRVSRDDRQKFLATLERTSYECNLLPLMPGRPEINELFVGYTHSLRLCTPRPHVSSQGFSHYSTKAESISPDCPGEIL